MVEVCIRQIRADGGKIIGMEITYNLDNRFNNNRGEINSKQLGQGIKRYVLNTNLIVDLATYRGV